MTRRDDCARVGDTLPEFLAGRLGSGDDEIVRRHLESCADCRRRANAVSLLQQTPPPVPDPARWDGFVEEVVAGTVSRPAWWKRRWVRVAALALLLLFALLFLASRANG